MKATRNKKKSHCFYIQYTMPDLPQPALAIWPALSRLTACLERAVQSLRLMWRLRCPRPLQQRPKLASCSKYSRFSSNNSSSSKPMQVLLTFASHSQLLDLPQVRLWFFLSGVSFLVLMCFFLFIYFFLKYFVNFFNPGR